MQIMAGCSKWMVNLMICIPYASSDSTTAASRPKLYIEYSTTTEIDPWTDKTYSYSQDKPHAVTKLKHAFGSTAASYIYDANGNMTCRVENNQTFLQYYNAENRMSGVSSVTGNSAVPGQTNAMWQFFYDGDGNSVEQVYTVTGGSTLTTYYFAGGAYEVQDNGTTQKVIKYYAFAGMTVAMNDGSGLKYCSRAIISSCVAAC